MVYPFQTEELYGPKIGQDVFEEFGCIEGGDCSRAGVCGFGGYIISCVVVVVVVAVLLV